MTKEECREYNKNYYQKHRESLICIAKINNELNRESKNKRRKELHMLNKENDKLYYKNYRELHKADIKRLRDEYQKTINWTRALLKSKLSVDPPSELVELHFINLKIKRLCKTLNN